MQKKIILCALLFFLVMQTNLFSWEPEEFNRLYLLGERLYAQGHYEEAILAFQELLEIYPDNDFAKDYIEKAKRALKLEPILEKRREKQEKIWSKIEKKRAKVLAKKEEKKRIILRKKELKEEKLRKAQQLKEDRLDRAQELKEEKLRQKQRAQEERLKKIAQEKQEREDRQRRAEELKEEELRKAQELKAEKIRKQKQAQEEKKKQLKAQQPEREPTQLIVPAEVETENVEQPEVSPPSEPQILTTDQGEEKPVEEITPVIEPKTSESVSSGAQMQQEQLEEDEENRKEIEKAIKEKLGLSAVKSPQNSPP